MKREEIKKFGFLFYVLVYFLGKLTLSRPLNWITLAVVTIENGLPINTMTTATSGRCLLVWVETWTTSLSHSLKADNKVRNKRERNSIGQRKQLVKRVSGTNGGKITHFI